MLGTRRARTLWFCVVPVVLLAGCSSGGKSRASVTTGPTSTSQLPVTSVGVPTTTASPPTTASAASSAIGDTCIIGRWVEQVQTGYFTANGQKVAISGQAGFVVTFSADGTEISDWSGSQPMFGQYRGQQLKVVNRGTATFKVHGDGGQLVETGPTQTLTTQAFLNGVAAQNVSGSVPAVTLTYTCNATTYTSTESRGTGTYSRG